MIVGLPKHIIWLDDEFGTAYEFTLSPWRRALDLLTNEGKVILHICSSISNFRSIVEENNAECIRENSVISLVILDVMLNYEECNNFELLGFPDERLISLQAGAQIAGLIRGNQYDGGKRASWVKSLASTPLLLLSANPQTPGWVRQQVGASNMRDVKVIMKDLRHIRGKSESESELEPSPDFKVACVELAKIRTVVDK